MNGKNALCSAAMVFLALVATIPRIGCAQELSRAQREQAEIYIRGGKEMSDKCVGLIEKTKENSAISTANFEGTGSPGFKEAADGFGAAAGNLSDARRLFDDGWIWMRQGVEQNDAAPVQKGIELHNAGVRLYNDAISQVRKAEDAFTSAIRQTNEGSNSADRRSEGAEDRRL